MTMTPATTVARQPPRRSEWPEMPPTSVMLVPADYGSTMTLRWPRRRCPMAPSHSETYRPGSTDPGICPPRPGGRSNPAPRRSARTVDVSGGHRRRDVTIRAGAVIRGRFVFEGSDQIAPNDVWSVACHQLRFRRRWRTADLQNEPRLDVQSLPSTAQFAAGELTNPALDGQAHQHQGKDVDEPIDFATATSANPSADDEESDARRHGADSAARR